MQSKNIQRGVLFDLDGVLIDSEKEYTRIWNLIDSEYPTGEKDFALKIKGTTLENILALHYPDPEVRKNVERRLYEEEAKMKYDYCPGARQLLQSLKKEGVKIALFTSSNGKKMEHLRHDVPELEGFFDAIVTGDMVSHSKPDPEGYLMAAHEIGIPAEDCIVVEDALQGVKAGKAAGCKVLGVAGTLPAPVLGEYADVVVKSLEGVTPEILLAI